MNRFVKKWKGFIDTINPPAPRDYWIPWSDQLQADGSISDNPTRLNYKSVPRLTRVRDDFFTKLYGLGFKEGKYAEIFMSVMDEAGQKMFLNNLLEDLLRHRIDLSKRIYDPNNGDLYFFSTKNADALSTIWRFESWIMRKLDFLENHLPKWLGTETELVELLALGLETNRFSGTNRALMAEQISRAFGKPLKGRYYQQLAKLESDTRRKRLQTILHARVESKKNKNLELIENQSNSKVRKK
ncbi:MAG: hypothetical protein R2804_18765 [Cyclobacteriaceae bacterium]